MKKIVVDASVTVKWFIPEVHSENAIHLLDKSIKFLAPSLIYAEVGNILWKKTRLKELTKEIAGEILNDFKKMPLEISENQSLLDGAWHIATQYQRTFYDSLYLALARNENCQFVTADQAFVNALKATDLSTSITWIEDIK
ncbi:MAG: type II toxin-antitoxin system VapC family toxin [Proteobacteria bacterium]|nr:type II toxin-antitoxin system VapC family toxin [Pseudomonadota bacterium]